MGTALFLPPLPNAGGAAPLFTCQSDEGGRRPLGALEGRGRPTRRSVATGGGPCSNSGGRAFLMGFGLPSTACMYGYGKAQTDTKRWRHGVWVAIDKTPRTATRSGTRVRFPAWGKSGGLKSVKRASLVGARSGESRAGKPEACLARTAVRALGWAHASPPVVMFANHTSWSGGGVSAARREGSETSLIQLTQRRRASGVLSR
ncbi:hypothetical protein VUR80DRAFT_2502 [Thermomyces stellatus]